MSQLMNNETELTELLSSASGKQADAVRKAIREYTLVGLTAREVSMKALKTVLTHIAKVIAAGLENNGHMGKDGKALMDAVTGGVDQAMADAVVAIETTAKHLIFLGANTEMPAIGGIIKTLEKFPKAFITGMDKASALMKGSLAEHWAAATKAMHESSIANKAAMSAAENIKNAKTPENPNMKALRSAQEVRTHMGVYVAGVMLGQLGNK